MYVCVYAYVCLCECVYVYVCICMYVCMYVCMRMYVYVNVCMYVYVRGLLEKYPTFGREKETGLLGELDT
jgi:hypothetical protein